jgi:hypothetical protein
VQSRAVRCSAVQCSSVHSGPHPTSLVTRCRAHVQAPVFLFAGVRRQLVQFLSRGLYGRHLASQRFATFRRRLPHSVSMWKQRMRLLRSKTTASRVSSTVAAVDLSSESSTEVTKAMAAPVAAADASSGAAHASPAYRIDSGASVVLVCIEYAFVWMRMCASMHVHRRCGVICKASSRTPCVSSSQREPLHGSIECAVVHGRMLRSDAVAGDGGVRGGAGGA